MDSYTVTRRLAAILSANVQGYSRLMGEDEEATLHTLTTYREIMAALIQQHRGRVVNSPGDNLLAEFDSVVEALSCAVTIQEELKKRNAQLLPHRQMEFRIGLNLGDVLVEEEQIYGEGVNIAARLEGLADGGGICVSGTVYDQVENKLALHYHYLGEQAMKNIAKPIRVYRVHLESAVPTMSEEAGRRDDSPVPLAVSPVRPGTVRLVGREAELAQLQQCLDKATRAERQVIFISGEPGIGKTTLVDAFLDQLALHQDLWITRGQCIEHYGTGEAYLPVLEALSRLGRERSREEVVATLAQYAPTWLAQLPALVNLHEREGLQRALLGATQERMLRELTDALEVLTVRHPLVMVLEDLHWSDHATVELIAYLAQRRGPARLFVVGTYRPVDVLASGHPLKGVVQELQVRGRCEELRLALLQEPEVRAYVEGRFAREAQATEPWHSLATLLHQRTGGNPLFMVDMVEHLRHEGLIVEEDGQWQVHKDMTATEVGVPDSLRQLIDKQFERLSLEEQQVLEAASVVGAEFAVAAVAAALEQEVEGVEEWCAGLAAKGQFVRAIGVEEWPDGTIGGRYSFLHALYQQVTAERVAAAQRIWLHQRIGTCKETAYGQRAGEIAVELAVHFEAGRNYQRAVQYYSHAGENAVRRHAPQEALRHLTKGLALLQTLPDTRERAQQELRLQSALGAPLIAIKGYAAPEVGTAYTRARALCQQIGDTPQLFSVLYGLSVFHLVRAELPATRELGEQLLHLAKNQQDPALLLEAHQVLGLSLFYLGKLTSARKHLEQGITLYDPQQHGALAFLHGHDHGVVCLSYAAWLLWLLGYPDQALKRSQEALSLARALSHPFSLAFALNFASFLHHCRREGRVAQEQAEALVKLSLDQGFAFYFAHGTILRGGALAEQGQEEEGIMQMRQGLAALRTTGAALRLPHYLATLAMTYARRRQGEEAASLLTRALEVMHTNEERVHEAELHRLKGELTLKQSEVRSPKSEVPNPQPLAPSTQNPTPSTQSEAEACFLQAIEIARRQQAKSLELRAALSLGRLWQQQGKIAEARQLLEEIYGWFSEGFDTKDLQDAEALLSTLGSQVEKRQREQSSGNPAVDQETTLTDSAPMPIGLSSHISLDQPQTSQPIFRKEGEYWTLTFQSTTCRVKDTSGMQYLAYLLQHPHQEIHALALASGSSDRRSPELSSGSPSKLKENPTEAERTPQGRLTDAGEILDPQAKTAYKRRLEELQAELEEAQAFNDPGRTARAQEEIDFLTQELVRAVGLGGRSRKAASPTERARVNVTRAIKAAIDKISKSHPPLGQHLTQTIKTGTFCAYTPGPHHSYSWQI